MAKKTFLILSWLIFFCLHFSWNSFAGGIPPEEGKYYQVVSILDGDTFVLENEERVRLVGLDSPEAMSSPKLHRDARKLGVQSTSIKAMGLEAKTFTRNLILGKKVRLEYEGEQRDGNGRLLAYVYLENNLFVNGEILRQGHAVLLENSNLRHQVLYDQMQNEAIAYDRGLWNFLSRRIEELFEERYHPLTPSERKEVLEYIDQLRGGKARETYTPIQNTSVLKETLEPVSSAASSHFPKSTPL